MYFFAYKFTPQPLGTYLPYNFIRYFWHLRDQRKITYCLVHQSSIVAFSLQKLPKNCNPVFRQLTAQKTNFDAIFFSTFQSLSFQHFILKTFSLIRFLLYQQVIHNHTNDFFFPQEILKCVSFLFHYKQSCMVHFSPTTTNFVNF